MRPAPSRRTSGRSPESNRRLPVKLSDTQNRFALQLGQLPCMIHLAALFLLLALAWGLSVPARAHLNPSDGGQKPRLIPLAVAESGYSENSSVNILCTISQGHHETLHFDWFKDGSLISSDGLTDAFNLQTATSSQDSPTGPKIEKHPDHSLLRIAKVQQQHAGRYTCSVRNSLGQDSSSVNLIVNVKLQWTKEPPKEIVVTLNSELKVDCLAQGEPRPAMRWDKLHQQLDSDTPSSSFLVAKRHAAAAMGPRNQLAAPSQWRNSKPAPQALVSATSSTVSSTRYLHIPRARESDAGIYECVASNSHDSDLRKLVHVQVRGPPKILPIATADSYPEGSSINLICTVSGGQRRGLTLSWLMDNEELSDQRLKYSKQFDNLSLNTDDADISILKIKNATQANSGQYTCIAKNPLGEDSTSVKIVINVELKWKSIPRDVEIGLNKDLTLECDAIGSPAPSIEWFKHSKESEFNETLLVSSGKYLKIARAHQKDSGLYECVAKNGLDDDLRKIVAIKVRGPPKILPIASADSYPEGSTINLICTVSGGQRKGLTLTWMKDANVLNDEALRYSDDVSNVSIEKTGADITILRINNASSANSGRYACSAKNPLGEDSTAVNIVINIELKWKKLPSDVEVGLGQDVSVECDAVGQPAPKITWLKHPQSAGSRASNDTGKSMIVSHDKMLKIARSQHKDSGLYECTAHNGVDQDLRRIIQVKVRGKFISQH